MAKTRQTLWIFLILAAAFLVVGAFIQKDYGLFAILPAGEYRSNSDCTFLTNLAENSLYKSSNAWISVNGKAYGEKGYSSFSCTSSDATILPIKTVEGYDICTRAGYAGKVYIREGNYGIIFQEDYETDGAITSCGSSSCTPSWTCTPWSACVANLQTRTCTDSNSCGDTSGKPAESQSCSSGGECISFDQLITYANQWVACN